MKEIVEPLTTTLPELQIQAVAMSGRQRLGSRSWKEYPPRSICRLLIWARQEPASCAGTTWPGGQFEALTAGEGMKVAFGLGDGTCTVVVPLPGSVEV